MTASKVSFRNSGAFSADMKAAIQELRDRPGWLQKGYRRIRVKALLIDSWALTFYLLLVLVADNWWLRVPFAVGLTAGILLIAFCIQHDGNHQAFGRKGHRLNWWARAHLDLIGVSSRGWDEDHNKAHHTWTNTDKDHDIDLPPLARVSPKQPLRWFHRWQHIYLFPLYGITIISWQFWKDFRFFNARFYNQRKQRYDRRQVSGFVFGKLLFLSWAMFLPLALNPTWKGLLGVVVTFLVINYICSFVFMNIAQAAHVVEGPEFGDTNEADEEGKMPAPSWREWQVRVTANFSRGKKLFGEAVGRLNNQIEHHQAADIPHTLYDDVAEVVEEVCVKHGVPYQSFPTFWAALGSHRRHLKKLGRRPKLQLVLRQ